MIILTKQKLELLKEFNNGKNETVTLPPLSQIFLLERGEELKRLHGQKAKLQVIKKITYSSARTARPIQQYCMEFLTWVVIDLTSR
ncbi:uncharacterized protein LOC121783438 isoform X2 [Salvia splendens]|uniref:uncharacterized protein LOC121783438 isoform X2 n=1 Tax=Salvia splendens TaxID=180675 RepID=UPI001C25A4FC|nr:uncharacterized protein LOC121783438 isoform X2 [Salvia splendens]